MTFGALGVMALQPNCQLEAWRLNNWKDESRGECEVTEQTTWCSCEESVCALGTQSLKMFPVDRGNYWWCYTSIWWGII